MPSRAAIRRHRIGLVELQLRVLPNQSTRLIRRRRYSQAKILHLRQNDEKERLKKSLADSRE